MDIDANSVNGLHSAWVDRYAAANMEIKNLKKSPPKSKRFNTDIWNEIYLSYKRRKNIINAYHEEAIETLTIAATPAGAEARHLINSANNTTPNCPTSPLNNDNNESTQREDSEDDTPDESNEDNDATTTISNHSLSTSSPGEVSSNITSLISLKLRPPGQDRFIIGELDVSQRFYDMQNHVVNYLKSNTLKLESDVHLILSLSSILLLQNNNRLHQEMMPFFGNKVYQKIRKDNLDSFNMIHKFPGKALLETIKIAQNVYEKSNDRISAAFSLLSITQSMEDPIDKKLILSASQLLQFLPMDPTNTDISETTLITRYVLPAIQPLFDDHDRDVRLEFTFTEPADNYNREVCFTGRPDCIITIFPHQTDNGVNVGFGEVKKFNSRRPSFGQFGSCAACNTWEKHN